MSKIDKKLQEMQILEQGLQNILLQKQAFQMELSEAESALAEVETSKDDVFKIVGQLMIKTEKTKIIDELSNKKRLLDLRLKNLDKQESSMMEKLESLREEVIDDNSK
jgi:prefoldin beta subunit